MPEVTIKLDGGKELARALRKLPEKVALKIERKAARRAMKPVLQTARATAPVDSGAMRRGLRLTSRAKLRTGVVTVKVDTGKRKPNAGKEDDPFYAGWVEYGTKERVVRHPYGRERGHLRVGKIEETRWLRNSLDDNAPRVAGLFTTELRGIIDEEAAKARRGTKR